MSTSTSWMPAAGKHPVNVGSSLNRALRASKGIATTTTGKRNNLPVRDFYSFRYNFKPPSIDPMKTGCIEVRQKKDTTSVTVEHPSSQPSEVHIFAGSETPAKDVDCILVFDEDTSTFTLEKLDSYINLSHERKGAPTILRSNTSPTPPPVTQRTPSDDLLNVLESALGSNNPIDATDMDSEEEKPLAAVVAAKPKAIQTNKLSQSTTKATQSIKASPSNSKPATAPKKPAATPRPSKTERSTTKAAQKAAKPLPPPPAPAPVSLALPTASARTPAPAPSPIPVAVPSPTFIMDVEEEDLQFGQPAQKRQRLSPPEQVEVELPSSSSLLALPGASTSFNNNHSFGLAPAPASSQAPPPSHSITIEEDSEDDEWDEVEAVPVGSVSVAADVDGAEELDMGRFMDEMNEEMGMDMDTSMQVMEESEPDLEDDFLTNELAQESPAVSRRPIPLGEFADQFQEDDDFSSSDDSDDE